MLAMLLWPVPPSTPATSSKQIENADRLLGEAGAAIDRGDVRAARDLLDSLLDEVPEHGMALLYRGQLARDRGDRDAALADWRRVGAQPANIAGTARYLEGTLVLEQGDAVEAERLFRRSIELHPRYVQPHARLLELYLAQARRDDVRRMIELLGAIRPWSLDDLIFRIVPPERATTPASGAKLMRSYVACDPHDRHSALALAVYLIEGENHAVAAEAARSLLAEQPGDARAAALLAEALLRQGEVETADDVLEMFPLEPASPALLWRSHGHLAAAKEDWHRAIDCLSRVVEELPEDSASLYRLGIAKRRLGNSNDAEVHLARSAMLDRMQRDALRIIWGRRDDPTLLVPIVVNVGSLLAQLNYPLEAARWFEQALAMHPGDPQAIAGMQTIARAVAENPELASAPDPFGPRTIAAPVDTEVTTAPRRVEKGFATSSAGRGGERPSDSPSPITLRDVHAAAKLDYVYFNGDTGFKHLVESMGGGVGVLDFDADGRPDLYFPQGCSIPPDPNDLSHLDRLFRNRGDGTFADVTDSAGIVENRYGQGIAVGDLDDDGFADVAVANYGRNTLYLNNGDGTFRDETVAAGLGEPHEMSSSLAFADLDRDGDLDLYVTNYVTELKVCQNEDGSYSSCNPTNFDAQQDRLYQNSGDGTFEEGTQTSGIIAADGKGLGVLVADFDDDGRQDVYVANDTTPNFLFRNVGEPGELKFVEEGLIAGVALSGEGRAQAGMGVACADFDGDLRLDLHVTNFYQEANTLYLNLGGGAFSDSTRAAGLAEPSFAMLGFGTQAVDFNLDGSPDLFVANGHIDDFRFLGEPWKMPPQLFMNRGGGRFDDVSEQAAAYFAGKYLGRGVARLDFDADGRPDLIVVHQDRPVGLLRNETPDAGHFLSVGLHGVQSNRDAVGARILVTAGNRTQLREVTGGDGFFAANEKRQFVGLGEATVVESLEIHWPSGQIDRWKSVPADTRLLCIEGRTPLIRSIDARK